MVIDDKIKDEKLQYGINRETAKISALPSGKIDKYEYPTSKEILPSDQNRTIEIEHPKLRYSPLAKAFEQQIKTIEDQWIKHIEPLKALKPEENKQDIKSIHGIFPRKDDNETETEIDEIQKWEVKIKGKDLKYKTKNTHDFQHYETVRSFGDNIDNINIDWSWDRWSNPLKNVVEFSNNSRPRKIEKG